MTASPSDQAATNTELAPIVKTREVPLEPAAAFTLFTRQIGEWWPTDTVSISGDEVAEVVFEERLGGKIVEISNSGERHAWADVTAWAPPERFALAWHGAVDPVATTDLDVTFTPTEDGTRVRLVHTGWERFGDRATEVRDNYHGGWDLVLGCYLAGAGVEPDSH